jgi:hypothetical protein
MMIAINDDVDKCDDVNNDDDESEKVALSDLKCLK